MNSTNYNVKVYETITESGGLNKFVIKKVEEMQYNKKTAHIWENKFKKQLNSNLNEIKAFSTLEETKQYKNTKNNCNCGGTHSTKHKARHFRTDKLKWKNQSRMNEQELVAISRNYNAQVKIIVWLILCEMK